jgi:hypothetical protein
VAFDLWFTYHLPCYVCRMKLIYSVWGQLQQGEGIFQKPKYWNVFIVFKNDLLHHWRSVQGQESFEFHFHSVVTVVTLSCSHSRICVGFQNFFFYICRAARIHQQFRSRWHHMYVCSMYFCWFVKMECQSWLNFSCLLLWNCLTCFGLMRCHY